MKTIFFLLFLTIFSSAHSQELTWYTDMNKAVEVSKKENKPLFLFFTGSDWCGWCIRLQNEVFKTPEFIKWAKENVILVEVDFPRKTPQSDTLKNQNASLNQLFEVRGYPTVWFVKSSSIDGKNNLEKLGSSGYVAGGPTVWIEGATKILNNTTETKAGN